MLGFDPGIHGATPLAFARIDVTVPFWCGIAWQLDARIKPEHDSVLMARCPYLELGHEQPPGAF